MKNSGWVSTTPSSGIPNPRNPSLLWLPWILHSCSVPNNFISHTWYFVLNEVAYMLSWLTCGFSIQPQSLFWHHGWSLTRQKTQVTKCDSYGFMTFAVEPVAFGRIRPPVKMKIAPNFHGNFPSSMAGGLKSSRAYSYYFWMDIMTTTDGKIIIYAMLFSHTQSQSTDKTCKKWLKYVSTFGGLWLLHRIFWISCCHHGRLV